MIHLFNNVTMRDLDHINYQTPFDFEVVSTEYERRYYGADGCRYSDFDLAAFIERVDDSRLTLYCDVDSLTKIVAKFYKSTTDMDKNAFVEMMRTIDYRATQFNIGNEQFFPKVSDAWDEVEVEELPDVTHSYEMLLVNAFIDNVVMPSLKPMLSKFIMRQHKNIFTEAKHIVENNITSPAIQVLMGNGSDALPPSKINELDWTVYESDVSDAVVRDWVDSVFAANEPAIPSPSLGWPFIDELVGGDLSDASYAKVISDIKSANISIPYMPEDLIETINTQFVCYARNLTDVDLKKYRIK